MERLSEAGIEVRLEGSVWRRRDEAIERDVECESFVDALAFVNAVGELAEAANHHPDILIHAYKHVRLTLSTHSAGGLTEGDFALARAIDGLR
jgi:4a-hydroxytetrahydrobiopterin dehydratase